MPCCIRFVAKAEVQKVFGSVPTLGDVVPFREHRTAEHLILDGNADKEGRDLYLVSAGPDDAAWLVGVLREPTPYNGAAVWKTKTPNAVPVIDITTVLGALRLRHGEGVVGYGRKRLASALSSPAYLTAADRRVMEKALTARGEIRPVGQPVRKATPRKLDEPKKRPTTNGSLPREVTRRKRSEPKKRPTRTSGARKRDAGSPSILDTSFIPTALGQTKPRFAWKGLSCHIGPVDRPSKMTPLLMHRTTAALQSIAAGLLLWGARALAAALDEAILRRAVQKVEASFAYQVDHRYVDFHAGSPLVKCERPPARSAMFELEKFFGRALWHESYWESEHGPVIECSAMTYLVRHILPRGAKAAFEAWLCEVLDRAGQVAKKPKTSKERNPAKRALIFRGPALAPAFLATNQPFNPAANPSQVALHLRALARAKNPFLTAAFRRSLK